MQERDAGEGEGREGEIFMMLDVKLCVSVWLLLYRSALFFPPHENSALCASRCFFDSGAGLQV